MTLGDIDPSRVPLPVGTEVETRAVGLFRGRRIPSGAVGRIRSSSGDRVSVLVVGVGVLEFMRCDVLPRKKGQLQFALRRERLWQALHENVVVRTEVGSRAWGLADETSDHDYRGVFVLPLAWTVGLAQRPGELVSIDGGETYWEATKAVRQGLKADPNTLEALHLESAEALDEMGTWLLDARDAFVSAEIYGSFGRYALGQLRRLETSRRLAAHRTLLLEWLRDEPSMDLDAAAEKLADAAQLVATSPGAAVLRAKEYIKQLYSSLFDRGELEARDFAGLRELAAADATREFETARELRPKNAYNLLRLIELATGWLATGRPKFTPAEPFRSELRAIKRGELDMKRVIERADELAEALEDARRATVLPAKPDIAAADRVLRRIGLEVAKRSVSRVPGPFGKDAPAMPEFVT